MSQRNVTTIGMCFSKCERSEGITLSNGGDLAVNTCPSGDVCIQFCSGLAVRYTIEEIEQVGDGNPIVGISAVVRELRSEPEAFTWGVDRPFDDRLRDQL